MWTAILSALKGIISQIENGLSKFWQDIEEAFPDASQAAISELTPLAMTIVNDLNGQSGLSGKQVVSEALAQVETALLAAGKTFIIQEALGAIAIAVAKTGTQTAAGNGGVLPQGNQATQD